MFLKILKFLDNLWIYTCTNTVKIDVKKEKRKRKLQVALVRLLNTESLFIQLTGKIFIK